MYLARSSGRRYFGPNDNLQEKAAERKANQNELITQIEVTALALADTHG